MVDDIGIVRRNQDRRYKIEADTFLPVPDAFSDACFLVVSRDRTILGFHIEPAAVCGIDLDVCAVSPPHMLPIFEPDGEPAALCAGALPRAEVLGSAVDVIGKFHVDAHGIE